MLGFLKVGIMKIFIYRYIKKYSLVLCLFASFFSNVNAQETYSKRIDIDMGGDAISEAFFYKNNIIVYGQGAKLKGNLKEDIYQLVLATLDKEGNLLNHKKIDSINVYFGNRVICILNDTIYAMVERENKNTTDTTSVSLIKMTMSFDSITSVVIPTKKSKYFRYYPFVVLLSKDGNIYCLLYNHQNELIKVSPTGKVLERVFVLSEQYKEVSSVMTVSHDGSVYIVSTAYLRPDHDKFQTTLVKYDKNLKEQWRKIYADICDQGRQPRIKEKKDGSLVFSTIPNMTLLNVGIDTSFYSFSIYNVDTSGKTIWRLPIYFHRDEGSIFIYGLSVLSNDDIVLSGDKTRSEKSIEKYPNREGWLMCISKEGKLKWERRIRDERGLSKYSLSAGLFNTVLEDKFGRLYACGKYSDTFPNYKPYVNNENIWIVRLDSMGCLTPNCDTTQEILGLREFIVLGEKPTQIKVFPNPASDILHIDFQGNEDWLAEGKIAYEILNSIGQVVRQGILMDSILPLNDIPKGNYILHFISKQRHGFAKIQKE
jgi:hypothetical protein